MISPRYGRQLAFMCAITLPIALQNPACAAGWSADGSVDSPVCTASNNQTEPYVVSDGIGGTIIAWRDSRTSPDRIYAQRLDSSGVAQWQADGVAVADGGVWHQVAPQVISDGNGGAIIAWTEMNNGAGPDIYAQKISSTGARLWGASGVAVCTANSNQSNPALISDGAGGAFITWDDSRASLDLTDIYAQHINSAGDIQWAANGTAVTRAAGTQTNPRITPDNADGAIIVWTDSRDDSLDLYAQRIGPDGTLLWPAEDVAISTATKSQYEAQIQPDGAGGAVIVWTDSRDTGSAIYGQRVDSAGSTMWRENGYALTTASLAQQKPRLVAASSGGAIVAWEEESDDTGRNIRAQKIDGNGVGQWSPAGVTVCNAPETQESIVITPASAGGAYIAWVDVRDSSQRNVYVQKLGDSGAAEWPVNGIPVLSGTLNPSLFHMATLDNGGVVVAWDQWSTGQFDIYADVVQNAQEPTAAVAGWELFE